jgi:hypothetical protein
MNDDLMNPPDDDPAAIRALLENLRRQQGAQAVPDFDDIVRWIDGVLPPERTAAVDAALARNPELRRALVTARLGHEETVSAAEIDRLDRLVIPLEAHISPFPVATERSSRRSLFAAAAAAALLLGPAWVIGAKIAEQQDLAESREIRESLVTAFLKGGR